jgi:hypothetical protein
MCVYAYSAQLVQRDGQMQYYEEFHSLYSLPCILILCSLIYLLMVNFMMLSVVYTSDFQPFLFLYP